MLEDVFVVQSAVSAFNNMALATPAFFWWAVLALPLFFVAYWCADMIMARIGWNQQNTLGYTSTWVAGLTLGWIVLFGGNYGVLRDGLSVLPMMTAAIVFLTSLFVSSHMRGRPLPRPTWQRVAIALVVLALVGLSDTHTWWGPLLQIGALVGGAVLGRFAAAEMRPVAGTILIILTTVVAILMQPEFFRFGQLGNLTPLHLGTMLVLGGTAMATLAIMNVNARGKIRRGVYIKLKWLARVLCALGAALFILTEAVPVFIGTLGALFVLFAMSVWHAPQFNVAAGDKMFALTIATFGIITTMPVITILGIMYWKIIPQVDFKQTIRGLL